MKAKDLAAILGLGGDPNRKVMIRLDDRLFEINMIVLHSLTKPRERGTAEPIELVARKDTSWD